MNTDFFMRQLGFNKRGSSPSCFFYIPFILFLLLQSLVSGICFSLSLILVPEFNLYDSGLKSYLESYALGAYFKDVSCPHC